MITVDKNLAKKNQNTLYVFSKNYNYNVLQKNREKSVFRVLKKEKCLISSR